MDIAAGLRLLADWFDRKDGVENNRKDEVQRDLRKWADGMDEVVMTLMLCESFFAGYEREDVETATTYDLKKNCRAALRILGVQRPST